MNALLMPRGLTGRKADAEQCGSYRWLSLAWQTKSSQWPHESARGPRARRPGERETVREGGMMNREKERKSIREAGAETQSEKSVRHQCRTER